jgi:EAL domain-containing protein (putative c-di-GMP-specific phosphodiesterase class I)
MAAETLLDRLLEPGALSVVFQPIMEYRKGGWRLHGVEALIRGPRGTHLEFPEILFEYVRRKNAAPAVDRRCVAEILQAARPLGPHLMVGLNVHAVTLEKDDGFTEFLAAQVEAAGRAPSQVTVEIVEHAPSWAGRGFARAVDDLRELGFSIALDDVGLRQSNFRMILECRPDYFKIDAYLVAGAHGDYYRRAVLRSIVELAASFGGTAIAEGVESAADLRTVLSEGVRTVQGYLLARPATAAVLGAGDVLARAAGRLPTALDGEPWTPGGDWLRLATRSLLHVAPLAAAS